MMIMGRQERLHSVATHSARKWEFRLNSEKNDHLTYYLLYFIFYSMTLVESIPTNLTYPSGSPQHLSTFDAWNTIMNQAKYSLDIASYYWVLRGFGNNSGPTDNEVCH